MKKFLMLILLGTRLWAQTGSPVPVSVQALFVPVGYDDNDDVVVTLDGYLPSACYQIATVDILRDPNSRDIWIQQLAYHFDGPCLQVSVPFTSSVSIGTLSVGDFTLITNDGKLSETLTVKAAHQPGPDDFLYAPVDSARVVSPFRAGAAFILNGRFTNTCLAIKEVIVTRHGKSIEVMPVMESKGMADGGRPCEKREVPFERVEPLPSLEEGRYLLHVRSLNGRSINTLFGATTK